MNSLININLSRLHYVRLSFVLMGIVMGGVRMSAQYSVFHTGLNSSDWSYNELMSCTIINNSVHTPTVYLNCTVLLGQRVVLRAQSNVFLLNKGSNMITRIDVDNKLLPIKTLLIDPQMRAMMDKTAMPIQGDYSIRLDIVERVENAVLTYTQYDKNVLPISPFLLITPFDGTEVSTLNPTFTWTRPNMGINVGGMKYNIKVVEIYNGQSPEQAIRVNAPVLAQQGLDFNMFQTPFNNSYFQKCQKYAWQVEVSDPTARQITNISEVWTFTTSCEATVQQEYQQTPFYQAKTSIGSVSYPAFDTLKVALEYGYTDIGKIKARIIEASDRQKEIPLSNQENKKALIQVGDNRFLIPLADKKLVRNKHYLLEITDETERYYIPFEYLYKN